MHGRALVLGAGGHAGIAWELGVLAGLADGAAPGHDAGLVIGTSAGSVVGALITSGVPLEDLSPPSGGPGTGGARRSRTRTSTRSSQSGLGARG